jgi:hypothetical protein
MRPEELQKVAHVWASPEESPARRDQALGQLVQAYCGPCSAEVAPVLVTALEPLVRTLARSIARNAPRTAREDFVNDAMTLLLAPRSDQVSPRICHYRPDLGSAVRWLAQVLRNCWRSERRRDRPPVGADATAMHSPAPFVTVDVALDLTATFSPADLGRVHAWDTRARVEVLTLSGLWPKVPPHDWEAWLEMYEGVRTLNLHRPFPPDEFLLLEDPQDRMAPLAERLGYPANTLAQRWRRGRSLLDELDFIRDIRTGTSQHREIVSNGR